MLSKLITAILKLQKMTIFILKINPKLPRLLLNNSKLRNSPNRVPKRSRNLSRQEKM